MGISDEYNLAVLYPELLKKWHPTRNGPLTPDQVLPRSNEKAWWVCPKGHEWLARVASVTTGSGCPYCTGYRTAPENSLGLLHPEVAREWHPTKNGTLLPVNVSSHSGQKVWWICSNGHEWSACTFSRTRGSGCPYCSGLKASKEHSLQAHNPELAKEWHPEKNGKVTSSDVTPFSGSKRWWLCKQGHEWEATVANRAKGRGCPYCAGRLAKSLQTHNPLLAKEWHPTKNGTLTSDDVKPGSRRKVWWLCGRNHGWIATVNSRSRGSGCPHCRRGSKKSSDDSGMIDRLFVRVSEIITPV
jgi:hypothetical protein